MLHALCSQSPYYRPDGSRQPLVGLRTRHGFCGVCGLRAVVEQRHHILLATARGGANALLFGIYSPKSMTKALCAQGTSTQPLYTHWAQLSWVRWACVPRRVSAACPDALRACPTMALGAEAPMPVPSLIQGSEVPHTKSALTSFSIACWANADEDVATAWLITPAFSVLVVVTAKADMVPRLNALHLLLVQLLLADVAPIQAVFLTSASVCGRSINHE